MPEGQQYNPSIEKHVETTGVNIGRLKDTDLTREVADYEKDYMEDLVRQDPDASDTPEFRNELADERASQLIATEAADGPSLATAAARAASWELFDGDKPEDMAARRIEAAVGKAKETIVQYNQIQKKATTVRHDMITPNEAPEDEPE